eukprot:352749-Chlamydomonas_euryale.AAC.5
MVLLLFVAAAAAADVVATAAAAAAADAAASAAARLPAVHLQHYPPFKGTTRACLSLWLTHVAARRLIAHCMLHCMLHDKNAHCTLQCMLHDKNAQGQGRAASCRHPPRKLAAMSSSSAISGATGNSGMFLDVLRARGVPRLGEGMV